MVLKHTLHRPFLMSIKWSNRTQISYSFCLLFGDFIQLQKLKWVIKNSEESGY
ncbi:hypothetical protein E2C01_050022 [Portunus trituberculatus]|uniref:Uncharacterized protein n=1 Tax=Portunus trituberculatus TaxID=210409 RepID=A0A5B7GAZ1_PORTR|nr:hypothetical protein [Portunus trituberculatus]